MTQDPTPATSKPDRAFPPAALGPSFRRPGTSLLPLCVLGGAGLIELATALDERYSTTRHATYALLSYGGLVGLVPWRYAVCTDSSALRAQTEAELPQRARGVRRRESRSLRQRARKRRAVSGGDVRKSAVRRVPSYDGYLLSFAYRSSRTYSGTLLSARQKSRRYSDVPCTECPTTNNRNSCVYR